jgi:hypothetical protein
MIDNNFYTYLYLDQRKLKGNYRYGEFVFDYEPFYVGKGRNKRLKQSLKEAYEYKDKNPFKCRIIRLIKKELNQKPVIIK